MSDAKDPADRTRNAIERFLEGTLTDADEARDLLAALEADADLRREAMEALETDGMLRALPRLDDEGAFERQYWARVDVEAGADGFAAAIDRRIDRSMSTAGHRTAGGGRPWWSVRLSWLLGAASLAAAGVLLVLASRSLDRAAVEKPVATRGPGDSLPIAARPFAGKTTAGRPVVGVGGGSPPAADEARLSTGPIAQAQTHAHDDSTAAPPMAQPATEPGAAPVAAGPAPPTKPAGSVLYRFDFEDGVAPAIFRLGAPVPCEGRPGSCMLGAVSPWGPNATVAIHRGPELLRYSSSLLLSFDYFLGPDVESLDVTGWAPEQQKNHKIRLGAPVRGRWARAEIRLRDLRPDGDAKQRLAAGERMLNLVIEGGPIGGSPFYVDNFELVDVGEAALPAASATSAAVDSR